MLPRHPEHAKGKSTVKLEGLSSFWLPRQAGFRAESSAQDGLVHVELLFLRVFA